MKRTESIKYLVSDGYVGLQETMARGSRQELEDSDSSQPRSSLTRSRTVNNNIMLKFTLRKF